MRELEDITGLSPPASASPRLRVNQRGGVAAAEAENLRHRAELMIALTNLIEQRRWTQAFAVRAMGVTSQN